MENGNEFYTLKVLVNIFLLYRNKNVIVGRPRQVSSRQLNSNQRHKKKNRKRKSHLVYVLLPSHNIDTGLNLSIICRFEKIGSALLMICHGFNVQR